MSELDSLGIDKQTAKFYGSDREYTYHSFHEFIITKTYDGEYKITNVRTFITKNANFKEIRTFIRIKKLDTLIKELCVL